jgi:hypothetical protein
MKEKERVVEKLSYLATLISYHESDMYETIMEIDLLGFLLKICNPIFKNTIRANAVLAISLLSENEIFFQEMLKNNTLDLILKLCMDPSQDIHIKQYATQSLVHFALNKKSINILIEKKIINLFGVFRTQDDDENSPLKTALKVNSD